MNEPTYKLPAFTLLELVSVRASLKAYICTVWKWRHHESWRTVIRDCIAVIRKTDQREVA